MRGCYIHICGQRGLACNSSGQPVGEQSDCYAIKVDAFVGFSCPVSMGEGVQFIKFPFCGIHLFQAF